MRHPPALLALVAVAFLAGCDTKETPTSPVIPPPSFDISDAVHSEGNPFFYWRPPMAEEVTYGGTFDASLFPVVSICDWDPVAGECSAQQPLGFPLVSGQGVLEPVGLGDGEYHVNWHTNDADLASARTYRIDILVGGVSLGYADVDVVDGGKDLKRVDTNEYIPLKDGRTLPIKFRIEQEALYYAATGGEEQCEDCGVGVVGPTGGEVRSGLGWATVQVAPGVLTEDILVTVERLNHDPGYGASGSPFLGTGPFPTDIPQYGPFYRVTGSKGVSFPGEDVTLTVCQIQLEETRLEAPEDIHDELMLGRRIPGQAQGVRPLDRVDPLPVDCSGVLAMAGDGPTPGLLSSAFAWLGGMVGPTPLGATHMRFSHAGAASRLAGFGHCTFENRPPPGTVWAVGCGEEFGVLDPSVLAGSQGDVLFLSTFDNAVPVHSKSLEVGSWQLGGTISGTVTVGEIPVGDLGGPGNGVMTLQSTTGPTGPGYLTDLLGSFTAGQEAYDGYLFTAGQYSMSWESVVGVGSTGGAVGATDSNGNILAMVEYEPGGRFYFSGKNFGELLSAGWSWAPRVSQHFELRFDLDALRASLWINGVEASRAGILPPDDQIMGRPTNLGRVLVLLPETGEAVTFGVDDVRVLRTSGTGIIHSSVTITPDPVFVTPPGATPLPHQIAVVDVEARDEDGTLLAGVDVDLWLWAPGGGGLVVEGYEVSQPPATDGQGRTQGTIIAREPMDLLVEARIDDTFYDPTQWLTFTLAGSIGGTVSVDGAGMAGLDVTLSGHATATQVTGPDGSYLFYGLEAGNYTVTASGGPGDDLEQAVSLAEGEEKVVDLGYTVPGATISGSVSYSVTPLPNVTVDLFDAVTLVQTTATSDGSGAEPLGSFSFSGVPEGDYFLSVEPSAQTPYLGVDAAVTVPADLQDPDFLDLHVPKEMVLLSPEDGGEVYINRTARIEWTPNPEAATYAFEVWDTDSGDPVYEGTSGSNQSYGFVPRVSGDWVPGKSYSWKVTAFDATGNTVGVTLTEFAFVGGTLPDLIIKETNSSPTPEFESDLEVSLGSDGWINCHLRVTNLGMGPIAEPFDVTVDFQHATSTLSYSVSQTLLDGPLMYEMNPRDQHGMSCGVQVPLPAGEGSWTVSATVDPGGLIEESDEGNNTRVESVAIPYSGSISGTVMVDGVSAAWGTVRLTGPVIRDPGAPTETFNFTGLPGGTYTVTVGDPFDGWTRTVELAPGENATVDFNGGFPLDYAEALPGGGTSYWIVNVQGPEPETLCNGTGGTCNTVPTSTTLHAVAAGPSGSYLNQFNGGSVYFYYYNQDFRHHVFLGPVDGSSGAMTDDSIRRYFTFGAAPGGIPLEAAEIPAGSVTILAVGVDSGGNRFRTPPNTNITVLNQGF